MLRPISMVISLSLCALGVWLAANAGISRLYARHSLLTGSLDSANRSVELEPADPESYRARATLFTGRGELDEAVRNLERAAHLRPRDYFLWQQLGSVRDQSGDRQGALEAFRQSVLLAPYYVQPRWHLGNLLVRMGREEEGLAELRRAVRIDKSLLPALIDLAFGIYGRDAKAVERAVQPQPPAGALLLARSFARHGNAASAIEIFRQYKNAADDDRRALLLELIRARQFAEAYEVWRSFRDDDGIAHGVAIFNDGDFESNAPWNDQGFGWQIAGDVHEVSIAVDANHARSGKQSLRFVFDGNYEPSQPLVSQLILVQPQSRYRLRFSALTKSLTTGGLPVVVVTDADDVEKPVLVESEAVPEETDGWRDFILEFKTLNHSKAVLIALRRRSCTRPPCPIFGQMWLDNFSLEKL